MKKRLKSYEQNSQVDLGKSFETAKRYHEKFAAIITELSESDEPAALAIFIALVKAHIAAMWGYLTKEDPEATEGIEQFIKAMEFQMSQIIDTLTTKNII